MIDFRTVTFHIASYIPVIHQVSVRNAGGDGGRGTGGPNFFFKI